MSVALDLHTEQRAKDGTVHVGGIILLFAKTPKADMAQRCEATAVLIHKLVEAQATPQAPCDPQLCIAIDVFNGKAYRAKKQHRTTFRAIETSCTEVAAIWPMVPPPSGYQGPPVPGFFTKTAGR